MLSSRFPTTPTLTSSASVKREAYLLVSLSSPAGSGDVAGCRLAVAGRAAAAIDDKRQSARSFSALRNINRALTIKKQTSVREKGPRLRSYRLLARRFSWAIPVSAPLRMGVT